MSLFTKWFQKTCCCSNDKRFLSLKSSVAFLYPVLDEDTKKSFITVVHISSSSYKAKFCDCLVAS